MSKKKHRKAAEREARQQLKALRKSDEPRRPDTDRLGFVGRTIAGIYVTPDRARRIAAVWACVRYLSQTVGMLPWNVMQSRAGKGAVVQSSSPLQWLIHNRPSPEWSSFQLRETLINWALLEGNGYAEIDGVPDAVIDVFSGAAFVWAEAVAGLLGALGKPFVLTVHGGSLPAFAARWPRRVRRLLAAARVVTAPSGYLAGALAPYRSDIRVIANAVDAAGAAFSPRGPARPRLVWLRAFHAVYRPTLAIDVVAALAPAHPALTLAMVGPDKGDGSHAAAVAHARARGVAERVRFVGRVPHAEVAGQLAAADVLLNTPDLDNNPVSVIEAMAAGLCVVSTDVGGLRYLIDDGASGLLVPPADPAAMAAQVDHVLTDPALASRLSRGARAAALARDWAPVGAQWLALLDEVARG